MMAMMEIVIVHAVVDRLGGYEGEKGGKGQTCSFSFCCTVRYPRFGNGMANVRRFVTSR